MTTPQAQSDKEVKNEYLPEDQDLLNELASIDIRTTGMGLEMRKHEVSMIQIKAILRSRKSMVDFDQSSKKYTLALIMFTIFQLVLVVFQFSIQLSDTTHTLVVVLSGVTCLVVIASLSAWFVKIMKGWK